MTVDPKDHLIEARCGCCNGEGIAPDVPGPCPKCGGNGKRRLTANQKDKSEKRNPEAEWCPTCNGNGYVWKHAPASQPAGASVISEVCHNGSHINCVSDMCTCLCHAVKPPEAAGASDDALADWREGELSSEIEQRIERLSIEAEEICGSDHFSLAEIHRQSFRKIRNFIAAALTTERQASQRKCAACGKSVGHVVVDIGCYAELEAKLAAAESTLAAAIAPSKCGVPGHVAANWKPNGDYIGPFDCESCAACAHERAAIVDAYRRGYDDGEHMTEG